MDELRENEEKFRSVFEGSNDAIMLLSKEGFFDCNGQTLEMFTISKEDFLKARPADLSPPFQLDGKDSLTAESERIQTAYQTGSSRFEWLHQRKNGEIFNADVSLSAFNYRGQTVLQAAVRDITDKTRMEKEIREISVRDQLTELYNRRGFITLAEQQLKAVNRAKRKLTLTFLDCDGLKWINDTLGHEEGDKSLIAAANILRQTFRESDIIARMGGDEFVVLTIDAVDMNPEVLSKRLRQNIDEYNATGSRQYELSMSWGTAIYDPESPISLDELILLADTLMYTQKKAK